MTCTTFISAQQLHAQLHNPDWVIVDCRFNLSDPDWGREAYQQGHIPGAIYADLEKDLSGPVHSASGRHPLPDPDLLAQTFGAWGIGPETQVIAYDSHGSSFAARLWCLLRLHGHTRVAVLDGDFNRWVREGYPQRQGTETNPPRTFTGQFDPRPVVSSDELVQMMNAEAPFSLIDARSPERFRGEVEPVDRLPGHIPGAVNRFHGENLGSDGLFKSPAQLRAEYLALLDGQEPGQAVVYCGSGVTSCLHLVAMEAAGLPGARIYVGSWSEWIQDPNRPVALG